MNGRKKLRKILRTWIYAKAIQAAGSQETSMIKSVQDVAQLGGPKNRSDACGSIHGSELQESHSWTAVALEIFDCPHIFAKNVDSKLEINNS